MTKDVRSNSSRRPVVCFRSHCDLSFPISDLFHVSSHHSFSVNHKDFTKRKNKAEVDSLESSNKLFSIHLSLSQQRKFKCGKETPSQVDSVRLLPPSWKMAR
jgi:hypothetical protein